MDFFSAIALAASAFICCVAAVLDSACGRHRAHIGLVAFFSRLAGRFRGVGLGLQRGGITVRSFGIGHRFVGFRLSGFGYLQFCHRVGRCLLKRSQRAGGRFGALLAFMQAAIRRGHGLEGLAGCGFGGGGSLLSGFS